MTRLLHLLQSFVYYHFRERVFKPESWMVESFEIEEFTKKS